MFVRDALVVLFHHAALHFSVAGLWRLSILLLLPGIWPRKHLKFKTSSHAQSCSVAVLDSTAFIQGMGVLNSSPRRYALQSVSPCCRIKRRTHWVHLKSCLPGLLTTLRLWGSKIAYLMAAASAIDDWKSSDPQESNRNMQLSVAKECLKECRRVSSKLKAMLEPGSLQDKSDIFLVMKVWKGIACFAGCTMCAMAHCQ